MAPIWCASRGSGPDPGVWLADDGTPPPDAAGHRPGGHLGGRRPALAFRGGRPSRRFEAAGAVGRARLRQRSRHPSPWQTWREAAAPRVTSPPTPAPPSGTMTSASAAPRLRWCLGSRDLTPSARAGSLRSRSRTTRWVRWGRSLRVAASGCRPGEIRTAPPARIGLRALRSWCSLKTEQRKSKASAGIAARLCARRCQPRTALDGQQIRLVPVGAGRSLMDGTTGRDRQISSGSLISGRLPVRRSRWRV